jgi:hypothetical protein
MGSIYIILASHCEHNETGCYRIDTGYFFLKKNIILFKYKYKYKYKYKCQIELKVF